MKTRYLPYILLLVVAAFLYYVFITLESKTTSKMNTNSIETQDSLLRHIVLFKFKEATSKDELETIEKAFAALPSKISEIADFEWGTNNSPEGLDKGFTHSFFVSFKSEEDRAVYLPHPDHQAFVTLAKPNIEDVLVLDYWVKN